MNGESFRSNIYKQVVQTSGSETSKHTTAKTRKLPKIQLSDIFEDGFLCDPAVYNV